MALTVQIPAMPPISIDHPDAAMSGVIDGHLALYDTDGAVVAWYAPGCWASVSVTPSATESA